ncbi:hypothetical protein PRIPAC_85559 [Pristionchus pacificus]|uniref:Uncharacterized protein n=1 Tax=Pristionchus pacificus TaxID=54126 RepID=A0A2A6BTW8_PRIPA|nr:hypothetical protein PRIPAC_85559 [Pristionchus pacificus]|eukprot:PDM69338.1 hypothetical protein PRIPAC_47640 [Pristionchus pacificus]
MHLLFVFSLFFLLDTTLTALPTLPPNIGAREQGAIVTFKDCMAYCDRFPYNQGGLDRCMADCRNGFGLEIPVERNQQWPSTTDKMLKTLKKHEQKKKKKMFQLE